MVIAVVSAFLLGGAGKVGGRSGEVELLTNGRLATVWVNSASSQDPITGVKDRDTTVLLLRLSDPDGTAQGPVIQVNTATSGMQTDPQILALSGGRFVIAWTDGPSATGTVEAKAQIFSGTGKPLGGEIQLATLTDGDQEIPRLVATDGGDNFFASWTDDRPGNDDGLVSQHFNGTTGARIGAELTASSFGPSKAEFIQLSDGSYRYVADWVHRTGLQPRTDFPTILAMDGTVTQNPYAALSLNWDAEAIKGNRYVIAGQFKNFFDPAPSVGVNLFDAKGDPITDGFGRAVRMDQAINQTAFAFAGNSDPQVHALANGGFLVVWVQPTGTSSAPNYDIYAQQFDRDFYAIGGNVLVHSGTNGQQYAPSVTNAPNGRVLISWTSDQPIDGGNPSDVYGRLFRLASFTDAPLVATTMNDKGIGTASGDTIDLKDGADWFDGKGGADSVIGGNGNDFLIGNDGNDTLLGGSGFDVMQGGAGDDLMDGSFDFGDWITFGGKARITVNLGLTTAQNTGQGLDTILGVENLRGGSGADRITGSTAQNRLEGGAGGDVLNGDANDDDLLGGAGNDTLNGGTGNDNFYVDAGDDQMDGGAEDFHSDRIIYTGAANGVVNLATGVASFVGLGTDTLRNITAVQTGTGNDRVVGNGESNFILTDYGKDTVDGGAGNDTIQLDFHIGGNGSVKFADTLIYRTGGGADIVTDFNDDLDVLSLGVAGITTVAKALEKATDFFGSVLFDFGNGNTLRVDNISKAALADDIVIL